MHLLLIALLSTSARAEPSLSALDDGLRVYVEPRPGSKSVAIALAVGVGSANETPENNGAAHFLEHYLFTGTARWTETELQDAVERRGGSWNGQTTLHKTVYHVHLPAEELRFGLEWIEQVVFQPRFDDKLFERERNVVFQERGGRKGLASNTLERLGFGLDVARARRGLLFPGTGMALSVGGQDASLDAMTLGSLRAFYERYYVAPNASLLVVGGVSTDEVLAALPEVFADARASAAPPPLPDLPPLSPARQAVVRGPWDNDEQTLSIGARAVGVTSPDFWALRLLTQVLDKALTRELRQGRGMVYSVGATLSAYGQTGELSVTTTARGQHTAEIRAIVNGALDDAVAGPIDPEAVADAAAYLRGLYALSQEDNFNRAWWCADFVMQGALPPDISASLAAVTPAQLTDVARRYLAPELRREALHDPILTAWSGAALAVALVSGGALLMRWRARSRRV